MLGSEDEVLSQFFEESKERLASIEDDLLELEQQGDEFDYELVNCIFTAIQSVKGGSVFFGLYKLGELANNLSLLVDRIRRNEIALNADIIGALLEGTNLLYKMIKRPECIDKMNTTDILQMIDNLLSVNLSVEEKLVSSAYIDIRLPDGKTVFSINKYDFLRAAEDDRGGSNVYLICYDLIKDIEEKNRTPWEVISELLQLCVFIDSKVDIDAIGTLDSATPDSMPFYVLISTIIDKNILGDFLGIARENVYIVNKDGEAEPIIEQPHVDIVESIMDYLLPDSQEESAEVEVEADDRRADGSVTDEERDTVQIKREVIARLHQHAVELQEAKQSLFKQCECVNQAEVERVCTIISSILQQLKFTLESKDISLNQPSDSIDSSLVEQVEEADKQSIIMLKGGGRRMAIPLGLVVRIERFAYAEIIYNNGACYAFCQGKRLDLIVPVELLGLGELENVQEYIVAVIRSGEHEVGLIFDSIIAILNTKAHIKKISDSPAGIAGSLIINKREILLLDVYSIIYAEFPELGVVVADSVLSRATGVLIIDESDFFLEFLRNTCRKYGLVAYCARNRSEALEVLQEYSDGIGTILIASDFQVDLLLKFITDIKGISEYQSIEIVVTMALMGEEKRISREDTEHKVDQYLFKLDAPGIIASCLRLS